MLGRGIDSDRLLEDYRPVIEKATSDGYQAMDDIASIVKEFANEKYKESQHRSNYAANMKREGGFI